MLAILICEGIYDGEVCGLLKGITVDCERTWVNKAASVRDEQRGRLAVGVYAVRRLWGAGLF